MDNGQSSRKQKRKQKKRLMYLELIFLLIFVALVVVIIQRVAARENIKNEETVANELYQSAEINPSTIAPVSAAEAPAVQPEIAALMEQNPDAVGLLHFEGDKTLYVCQTTDNSYYITHRFDGSEDPAGMIYMDYRDSLWPRSDNLILYGHNMRDGSRFGTLKRFERKSHLLEYPIFQFSEKYETVNYVPFAIFHTTVLPDDPDYYAFDCTDFIDESHFLQYVNDVKARSVLYIPIDVAYGDKLLTLATCHSGTERGRLVIVCREVKASDPDSIKAYVISVTTE